VSEQRRRVAEAVIIRDGKEIQRAEPLLRAAYDNLAKQGDFPARSAAARNAWATRRSQRVTGTS
jgi:hypothetical protein